MEIEPEVKRAAMQFGVDPGLIQAVVIAEGNILKAVQCSFPHVTRREEALAITCRSAVHALSDYVRARVWETGVGFVQYWGKRWAPVGAENDPTGLNSNWVKNVEKLWPRS